MRRLLDTNAWVALQRGDAAVVELVRDAEEIVMSMVVVGELLFGFRHGTRYARNSRQLDAFLSQPVVTLLPVDRGTAEWFGHISTWLRRAGTPIPTNDVWIAAHAFEAGAELVSLDAHFDSVPGLLYRNPAATNVYAYAPYGEYNYAVIGAGS